MKNKKSVWLTIALTFLFGPFGLFYVSPGLAILVFAVPVLAFLSNDMQVLGLWMFFVWPISLVIGAIAAAIKS